jgi:O-antigen biosynthesis protein WbqV
VIYAIKATMHVTVVICAFLFAYTLRRGLGLDWWISDPQAGLIMSWSLVYGAIAAAYELIFRNERSSWSYTAFGDVVALVRATALTALTFLALIFISNRGITLPRSTLLLAWMLSLFALVGLRLAWRIRVERSFRRVVLGMRPTQAGEPLLLVGEPGDVASYLRQSGGGRDSGYEVIGVLTGRTAMNGQAINGVTVIGQAFDLEAVLSANAFQPPERVAVLFLDDSVSDLGIEPDVIGRLRRLHRPLLRMPSLAELKGGDSVLREIALEEFLPREPVSLDPEPVERLVAGRRVLVTGAGGSIGSEICRQLVAMGCAHITLVDHSEFLLFESDRQLSRGRQDFSKSAMLCDVRDFERLRRVMRDEQPEIVFHAAALKHVTLVEKNPCEAVLTNVVGTWNVTHAAREAGARQFVLISTDKAVEPTSFMGATKRIAETLLPESTASFRLCVVRFGNVLGSAGSVVPIFRQQIERGGPVTVTHRDVERYFMTIPEAVQLVLHAAAVSAESTEPKTRKFLLEMGKPVKIYDLARQMIELCGLRPGIDIEIEITGLKPGEKLTEELMDTNERSVHVALGLSELEQVSVSYTIGDGEVQALKSIASGSDVAGARDAVARLIAQIRGTAS